MAAVAAALRGEQVAYVDTTASFSGRRAAGTYHLLKPGLQVTMAATAVLPCFAVSGSCLFLCQDKCSQKVLCQTQL